MTARTRLFVWLALLGWTLYFFLCLFRYGRCYT
jgi:hypothetical protein